MTSLPTDTIPTLIIAVDTQSNKGISTQESILELAELAKTAQLTVIESTIQRLKTPNTTSYIGKGKVEEIKAYIKQNDIKCIITDDELTPAQSKFLEKECETKVMDRTGLILDIFSQRAQTYEAKLQIELAQLSYLLPRLTRLWTHLSRLGGGIGTRGPGETQLEVDKRQIGKRITHIKNKLKKIQNDRHLRRTKREQIPTLSGAIVGYTNAGKSTLMNRITNADVLAENQLFATLDPTSRQFKLGRSNSIILTDTVGFIQKLPTHLIKAFYSTLEEVTVSDFLIHVIDASHPCILECIETSNHIIKTLNSDSKPILYVFNKWDKVTKPNTFKQLVKSFTPSIFISIKYDSDLNVLNDAIHTLLSTFKETQTFYLPIHRMDIVNLFHKFGTVDSIEYKDKITITVTINKILAEKILASMYSE